MQLVLERPLDGAFVGVLGDKMGWDVGLFVSILILDITLILRIYQLLH